MIKKNKSKNKQAVLKIDGCFVKVNFIPKSDDTIKIAHLKKLILNGLAKS